MFTGLIERVGRVEGWRTVAGGVSLSVRHEPWPEPLQIGESVAVQGVCLTVTAAVDPRVFACDILDETLSRTNLRGKEPGEAVNLERALRYGDRMGGHIVSGHVDGIGRLESIGRSGRDYVLRVTAEPDLLRGMVLKGSVALDGTSLTISALSDAAFEVSIIPHTWEHTSLRQLSAGAAVNLETDMLGKFVQRHLDGRADAPSRTLTMDDLHRAGFV